MIRPIATELGLFLAPFVLYAALLLAMRLGLFHADNWPLRRIAGLAIVSLLLLIGSFVALAQFGRAPPGSTYIPAHIEGGKFVPQSIR